MHLRNSLLLALFCPALLTSGAKASDVVSLSIVPAEITLDGTRAKQQVAVTADADHATIRDVSATVELTSANSEICIVESGVIRPVSNGETTITAKIGNITASAKVTVRNVETVAPVTFHTEVLAALTKAGCNMGACHGSPSGKGGFRLSLRGYDPQLDLLTLRGEFYGRRANVLSPEESLLLQKPMMQVAHGGGKRLEQGGATFQVLRNWIAEGMQVEPAATATLERIDVLPNSRTIRDAGDRQKLIVNGYFSDGSIRDVTDLTAFDSSSESIATVTAGGVVIREGRGEVTVLARVLDRMATSQITFLTERPGFQWTDPATFNEIDALVFSKLRQLQILPSELCSDTDFLRRATLDLTGRLPTAEEVRTFTASTSATKRPEVIDQLLQSPEYASFWSLKWGDVLRCNSRRLTDTGVHKFRRWLFEVVNNDMPLSNFAHKLLTATGSTELNPAANYWRASRDEIDATETTAQLFLGIRIQCAKCHNHPFEKWTQNDYYGIAAAFNRVGRREDRLPNHELIYVTHTGEVKQPRTGETMKVRLLLKGSVDAAEGQDRRQVFADWLTGSDNPFFARSIANRIWGHIMGRGVVEPVDDFRDSNPPSNPELLGFLSRELAENNFSARHLIRTIMTSRVYQLSSQRNEFNTDDEIYFSHATTRMLTAEQLLDGICQLTGMPEAFDGMPSGTRAVDLVNPPEGHKFLQVFGQPQRELPCECERSTDSNLSQALQLINGPVVHNKVRDEKGNLHRWIKEGKSDQDIISLLYVSGLSRHPEPAELEASLTHIKANNNRTGALEDVAWAVINSKEFLFQH